jgi:mannose-6-phosphate isomerase-like protein (cupin superfamily)
VTNERPDFIDLTRRNEAFRRELITGAHSQLVAMTLRPGEEIGEEVHDDVDQIFLFVDGRCETVLDGESSAARAGQVVFVRAGTRHNVVNTGDASLRLLTIYAPPEHPPGTVHMSKEEAIAAEGG